MNAFPWEIAPGTGRATNTPQPEPKQDIAARGTAPGENFRSVTSLQKVETAPSAEPKPYAEPNVDLGEPEEIQKPTESNVLNAEAEASSSEISK